MANVQDYPMNEPVRVKYRVIILELAFFLTLCLGKFTPFGLPFSNTAIMLLFAWYTLWARGLRWRDVGLHKPTSWLRSVFLAACASAIIVGAFIWIILPLATQLTGKPIDFSVFSALHGNLPLLAQELIPTWAFAGGAEEMVFHAYLMNRFTDLLGKTGAGWAGALVISSVIFGAAPTYQGITGMITSGAIGLLLGSVYLFSRRNLWPAMICHALVDTTFFILVYFALDIKLFR
jgi:membrane protease YdiL (CAAX protease family)